MHCARCGWYMDTGMLCPNPGCVSKVLTIDEPLDWRQLALAKLGAERDIMTTEEVGIIQRFLGV